MFVQTGVTLIHLVALWIIGHLGLTLKAISETTIPWTFPVMGDFCWQSGEVVLVVIEEEKRSVETFYDCVDLDLEENPIDIDKVRSRETLMKGWIMMTDVVAFSFWHKCCLSSGIIHICQNLQRRLNKPIGTNCEETQGKGVSKFRCRIPENWTGVKNVNPGSWVHSWPQFWEASPTG